MICSPPSVHIIATSRFPTRSVYSIVVYMLPNALRYHPTSPKKEHEVVALASLKRNPFFENCSPVDILLTQKEMKLQETDKVNFIRHILYDFFLRQVSTTLHSHLQFFCKLSPLCLDTLLRKPYKIFGTEL